MTNIPEDEKNNILEALEAIKKQFSGPELSEYLAKDNAKLIECRHEIIISVMASVLEEDEMGNTVGAKEVSKQNYHIPVPSNQDYNEYLKGFFDFLEGCLSSSAEKMEQKKENNNG